jgi:DNA (cytosine-5)-methyltransferase 1
VTAYYNENDKKAAAWLRELIKAGAIAPGEVDDRSILDVTPGELAGFAQCHFFAGIGVWSYALRRAGWADDRPVWTGSCPCQPFSAAGKGAGFDDERHLWPAFFHLIEQCRPAGVFGEQVASKNADPWIDLVQDDLEALGYAFGAVPFPAAGVGAPHIRDRTYWVADSAGARRARPENRSADRRHESEGRRGAELERGMPVSGMAQSDRGELGRIAVVRWDGPNGQDAGRQEGGGLGDRERERLEGHSGDVNYPRGRSFALGSVAASGAVGGFWRNAEVVYCRDGKLRPVEPGSFPLAHGAPARVGRLRGYGNAIVAEAAAEFIRASQEVAA